MGPSIIKTVVRSNGKTLSPQMLRSTEDHQPYQGPSSSSGSDQPITCRTEFSIQAAARNANESGDSVQCPQHAAQVIASATAIRGCAGLGSITSPQISINSQGIDNHIPEANLTDEDKSISRDPVETMEPALSGASASTETPHTAVDAQVDNDDPIHKIGEMKIFDQTQKAIPKLYEARWQVILPDIFDQVAARLRRGRFVISLNKTRALPSIHLMSAGITKDLSIPAVVVMISKHTKKMQEFLNTNSTVQNLCNPGDGTTVQLLIFACKGRSTLIGIPGGSLQDDIVSSSDSDSESLPDDADSMISSDDSDCSAGLHSEVDAQSVSVLCERDSTSGNGKCGSAIRLVTKVGSRYVRGTCGGLLRLETPNHPPRYVGLLAGHLLDQLKQTPIDARRETNEDCFTIGNILHPKSLGQIPRHDWALFNAVEVNYQESLASEPNLTIAQEADLPEENTTVVIRTSRGEMTGTLSSTSSGIMLNPNQGFIHVRMIIMAKGSIVTKGDSGAWVVHEGLGKLYGYIVAANKLHAYMVPMFSAITEIEAKLGVDIALTVPTHLSPDLHLPGQTPDETFSQTRESIEASDTATSPGDSAPLNDADKTQGLAATDLEDRRTARAVRLLGDPGYTQERLPQEEQSRLAVQHELGKAHLENGRVLEAIEVLENVVKVRGKLHDQNHVDSLASQHELAIAYIQNDQPSEAIRLLEHVVMTEGRIFEKSHIGRLTSQHELGRAYLADGRVSEAIGILTSVVEVKEATLKKSDLHLLASQLVLAEAYLKAFQATDALELLKHVVDIAEATFDEHNEFRMDSRKWLNFLLSHPQDLYHPRLA